MKLSQMQSDLLLHELETRSDKLLKCDQAVGEAEAALKAFEACSALAHRDSGMSMAEAERRVQAGDEWVVLYTDLQSKRAQAAEAKRSYERAKIASDLWRTERASMRAV